jgi:GxxExxY protein
MGKLLHAELSYEIRGALYEVYNALGPGFREETYKIATCAEFSKRGVTVDREYEIDILYKDTPIDRYRLDIVVDRKIILELKAVDELHARHQAQLISYLRAANMSLGMLVNFGGERLKIIRLAK